MKRHLIIACCIIVCSSASNAQTLIPKIGGSLSNIATSDQGNLDGETNQNKLGGVIGVAFEIPLGKIVSIQPELLLAQKGVTDKYSDANSFFKQKLTLNYLELPVLFKFNLGMFYINAGPSFSYGIGGRYEFSGNDGGDSFSESGKVKFGKDPDNNSDNLYVDNALDLGFQFGGGIKIAKIVVIDLRYGLGLTNLADKNPDITTDNKSKNRCFQLTFGYPINFGK